MRRILLVSSLLAGLVAFGSKPAAAAISADINIHVGDRAPYGVFYAEPRGYLIPDYDNVWYYQNASYDMYRYGNVWYMNDGGYWYSARSWRGPFVGIRFESVPTRIVRVPVRYRHQSQGYWQQQAPYYTWNNQVRYRDSRQWRSQQDQGSRYNDRNRQWSRDNDRRDDRQWSRNDDDDHGKGKHHGRGHGKDKGNKGNHGRWH